MWHDLNRGKKQTDINEVLKLNEKNQFDKDRQKLGTLKKEKRTKLGEKEDYQNNFENFYWNVDQKKPNFIETLDHSFDKKFTNFIKNDNFRQI